MYIYIHVCVCVCAFEPCTCAVTLHTHTHTHTHTHENTTAAAALLCTSSASAWQNCSSSCRSLRSSPFARSSAARARLSADSVPCCVAAPDALMTPVPKHLLQVCALGAGRTGPSGAPPPDPSQQLSPESVSLLLPQLSGLCTAPALIAVAGAAVPPRSGCGRSRSGHFVVCGNCFRASAVNSAGAYPVTGHDVANAVASASSVPHGLRAPMCEEPSSSALRGRMNSPIKPCPVRAHWPYLSSLKSSIQGESCRNRCPYTHRGYP
jgi:hypothetical protein